MRQIVSGFLNAPGVRRITHRVKEALQSYDSTNVLLKQCKGIIHVGANAGQERKLYEKHGLLVVWIEPIPEVFNTLTSNLHDYPRQSAVRALVTDRDGTDYAFHISNNNGVSSSILEMKLHREMFPEVSCERTITLTSTTLVSLLSREQIPLSHYDGLILDTQGSELLVLQGALQILPAFRFIKTEVTDFESYAGGCQLKDLDRFLAKLEFREVRRRSSYRRHASGGRYYDVVYQNSKPLVESSHLM